MPGDALAVRSDAASRRRPGPHRREPALQHRDRAADRLAHHRAVAALVRPHGADVPARGRRAHRRRARQQDLWPAVGAVRRGARRRRSCSTCNPSAFVPPPKVTSSVVEFIPRAEPAALRPPPRWSASPRRPSASAARCCARACKSLGTDPLPLLDAAGIEPTARAEDIPVEGFVALARGVRSG